jgi:beta-glucanase (GH16 family)
MLLALTVTGCVEPSLSSSSGVPNGLQPLTPVEGCGVQTIDNQWVCVWADEFEGEALNTNHWNIEVNGDGGGNQEAQFYRAENIAVNEGTLKITGKRETFSNRSYTSGRINSRYKVNPQFGRVTFRAKMPAGRGTWAAVWMLPLFNRYGQWPNSGEIDILEYVGYDPGRVFSATHTTKFNHTKNNNPSGSRILVDPENTFYEYEMIWLPGEIRIFVEGNPYGTYRYVPQFNQDVPHDDVFPFQEEFYFIINLAIGGSWGGVEGIDPLAFPTVFEIDYLRLYQWDYASFDVAAPEVPGSLASSQLKNTIHWNRPEDDTWVSHYAIYLDGVRYREAKINQFTFVGLEANRTYQVQIEAIDFVGRTSPLTEPLAFTFGG